MENTFSQYLFLFLLSLSTSPPPPVEASTDRLRRISLALTHYDMGKAHSDCRANGYQYLAIARSALDVQFFSEICLSVAVGQDITLDSYGKCWVGLFRRDGVWRWNDGQNNPLPVGTSSSKYPPYCAIVANDQLMEHHCSDQLYFLCESNSLVLVKEEKTWEEALHHCRALGPDAPDLLSFHDEEELSYVEYEMARARTEEVWIGLRWLAGRWLWMDRTAGGVISLPECPANGTHCGTLSGGGQQARSCDEKRRFLCLKQAH